MQDLTTNRTVRRDFVAECEWDRQVAAIPEKNLVDSSLLRSLVEWAGRVAASFARGYRETIVNEEAEASAQMQLAVLHTTEMRAHAATVESEFGAAQQGSSTQGILMGLAFVLAVAGEGYLNRGVLPWILGVTGLGLWAMMVGPAFILPAVLERICHPLLESTNAWGRLARAVFYATTAGCIVGTVALIGLCRGAVSMVRAGQDLSAGQAQIVNATLLVLGICIAVCAVIAAYASGLELKRVRTFNHLEKSVTQAISDLKTAREGEAAASSKLAVARKRLEMCDGLVRDYEEEFLAARLAILNMRLANIKTGTDVTLQMDWAERLSVFRRLGLGWGQQMPPPLPAVDSLHFKPLTAA